MNKKRKNKIFDKIVEGLDLSPSQLYNVRKLMLQCIKMKSYTDEYIVSMIRSTYTQSRNWVPIDESKYGLLCGSPE